MRSALEHGTAALACLATPELLAVSPEGMSQADSPFIAAFLLVALEGNEDPRLRELVDASLRCLETTRVPPGLWSPPGPESEVRPPGVSDSACALLALNVRGAWGVGETTAALEALLAATQEDEADLLASADLLCLAARVGRPLPRIATALASAVRARGLASARRGSFQVSPFVLAYSLGRWLRQAGDEHGLAGLLWEEVSSRRYQSQGNPLDCALAVSSLLSLEPSARALGWERMVEDMVSLLVREQTEVGLWPAVPILVSPSGVVYGSLQLTTAACLEALERYQRQLASAQDGASAEQVVHPLMPTSGRKSRAPRPGTIADTLEAVRDKIPPALVSPEAFGHLRTVARWFPRELVDGFGLECRLGEPSRRADLFLWFNRDNGGREVLGGLEPRVELPAELWTAPAWQRIRDFCREWSSPGSPLHEGVDTFWLEFDVDGPPSAPPIPSIFFGTEASRRTAGADVAAIMERYHAITRASVSQLSVKPLSAETLRNLDTCFQALPPGAQAFAIGVMYSRPTEAIRVCIKDVPPERLMGFLAELGWPGPVDVLRKWVAHLSGWVRMVINLDIGPRLLPTTSLECTFKGRRQPREEPGWAALLEYMHELGLARADKREALLGWPGLSRGVQHFEGGMSVESHIEKRLSHVKFAIKSDLTLEAKGYLGAWRVYEKLHTR